MMVLGRKEEQTDLRQDQVYEVCDEQQRKQPTEEPKYTGKSDNS